MCAVLHAWQTGPAPLPDDSLCSILLHTGINQRIDFIPLIHVSTPSHSKPNSTGIAELTFRRMLALLLP